MYHGNNKFKKEEPKSFSLKNKDKLKDLPKAPPSSREKLNDFFRWLDDLWDAKAKVPMDEEYIFLCKNDIQVIKERAARINTTPMEATSMNPESKEEPNELHLSTIKTNVEQSILRTLAQHLTVVEFNLTRFYIDAIEEYIKELGYEVERTNSGNTLLVDLASKKEWLKRTKVDELTVVSYNLVKTIERYHDLNYCVEVAVAQTKPGSNKLNPYVEYTVSVYKLGA